MEQFSNRAILKCSILGSPPYAIFQDPKNREIWHAMCYRRSHIFSVHFWILEKMHWSLKYENVSFFLIFLQVDFESVETDIFLWMAAYLNFHLSTTTSPWCNVVTISVLWRSTHCTVWDPQFCVRTLHPLHITMLISLRSGLEIDKASQIANGQCRHYVVRQLTTPFIASPNTDICHNIISFYISHQRWASPLSSLNTS